MLRKGKVKLWAQNWQKSSILAMDYQKWMKYTTPSELQHYLLQHMIEALKFLCFSLEENI